MLKQKIGRYPEARHNLPYIIKQKSLYNDLMIGLPLLVIYLRSTVVLERILNINPDDLYFLCFNFAAQSTNILFSKIQIFQIPLLSFHNKMIK